MINELIIHLGDTKTGSTSIQRALVWQVCKAPRGGITYPTRFNHNGVAETLYKKRRFGDRTYRFNRVYKSFLDSDDQYGIISAEHFQLVSPQALDSAIKTYWPALVDRVRLVAYVRPHAGKFMSAFSQHVRLGSMMHSLDEFFDHLAGKPSLEYTPRFEAWRDTFGDRFELRPFVRDRLYQGDVVADFFKYLLGSEDFELSGTVSVNSSSTLSQLSLMREVHKVLNEKLPFPLKPRFREAQSMLGRIVSEYLKPSGLGIDSDKLRMPAALVDRFTQRYAPDAKALDVAFFDGTPMSDAMDKTHQNTTDKAQSLNATDYFQPEVISSVHIFANVLADILVKDPDHFKATVGSIRAHAE
jgi:hypothetical protein